jgi:hypothetical protein
MTCSPGSATGHDRYVASDRVTAAVAELYGADPGEFTARRKTLADAARAAGDRDAAKEITALRKPTRAAWVVNRLARADPGAPRRLADLAAGLRAATEAKDGRRLRELSARRGELVDGLTARALDAAGVADPPAGLREDVAATLTAALADPETAARFADGTLIRAAEWAGFGLLPSPEAAEDTVPANADGAALPEDAHGEAAAEAPVPDAAAPAEPAAAAEERIPLPRAQRRLHAVPSTPSQTATPPGRAQASDESAARRRKAIDDAERMVASAAEAAAAAVTEEERLEDTVRDLEEQLTIARAELSVARMRARRAETAERKARQYLDRLLPAVAPEHESKGAATRGLRSEARGTSTERRGNASRPERPEASAGYGWAVLMPADLRAAVLRSSRAA